METVRKPKGYPVDMHFQKLLGLATSLFLFTASSTPAQNQSVPELKDINLTTLHYGSDKNQTIDLYLPKHYRHPLPIVLWIHGGGFSTGNKKDTVPIYLLKIGFAVASMNYRLDDEVSFPAQLFDCKGAIRRLRGAAKQFKLDPTKIVAFGTSAGGTLAALLGTTNGNRQLDGHVSDNGLSTSVQAVIDFSGISDFKAFLSTATPSTEVNLKRFLGSATGKMSTRANLASPTRIATKQLPPFLIVHGTNDKVVPVSQSQQLFQVVKKAGGDAKLVVIKDAGHSLRGYTPAGYVVQFLTQKFDLDGQNGGKMSTAAALRELNLPK